MGERKNRIEIPAEAAAQVLFLSDRTCCVCRQQGRPIQLHHIDDDPSNNLAENLSVLCVDCHNQTQIRGGFDRKLDAAQVRLFKSDWLARVEARRTRDHGPACAEGNPNEQVLRYFQLRQKSEEHLYSFEADYVLVGSPNPTADFQANAQINGFISTLLTDFRSNAIATSKFKNEMKSNGSPVCWDSLTVSHVVQLFNNRILSLEFQLTGYGAGAAHPNTGTQTFNFRLHPFEELTLASLFEDSSDFLTIISKFCIDDLHKQRAQRISVPLSEVGGPEDRLDSWILTGAGPKAQNFDRFNLLRNGILFHFDPYHVDCYAAGKYEVFIPLYRLWSALRPGVRVLLSGSPDAA